MNRTIHRDRREDAVVLVTLTLFVGFAVTATLLIETIVRLVA